MATKDITRNGARRVPVQDTPRTAPAPRAGITVIGSQLVAVLRIAMGLLFGWAFLDKLFGFGYATGSANAWINGG